MAAACHSLWHSTQGTWRQPALPNSLVPWQPRAPEPSDSRMGKGEAGELCALPRAWRMTLLLIYSSWDHWAWAVVFPILLENIHQQLIWFQQTELCFNQYISQKASVKATLPKPVSCSWTKEWDFMETTAMAALKKGHISFDSTSL